MERRLLTPTALALLACVTILVSTSPINASSTGAAEDSKENKDGLEISGREEKEKNTSGSLKDNSTFSDSSLIKHNSSSITNTTPRNIPHVTNSYHVTKETENGKLHNRNLTISKDNSDLLPNKTLPGEHSMPTKQLKENETESEKSNTKTTVPLNMLNGSSDSGDLEAGPSNGPPAGKDLARNKQLGGNGTESTGTSRNPTAVGEPTKYEPSEGKEAEHGKSNSNVTNITFNNLNETGSGNVSSNSSFNFTGKKNSSLEPSSDLLGDQEDESEKILIPTPKGNRKDETGNTDSKGNTLNNHDGSHNQGISTNSSHSGEFSSRDNNKKSGSESVVPSSPDSTQYHKNDTQFIESERNTGKNSASKSGKAVYAIGAAIITLLATHAPSQGQRI